MNFKKWIILGLTFGSLFPVFGQVKISEFIQPSKLSQSENNSLYFIDFWATWCVPCLHVSKYLETLQSQYPNQFYVLSLTQENSELVNRFIEKHPTKLAVAIDYEGEFFKANKVKSLPYGILFNAKGDKLWEGHPANFKSYLLKHFLKRESNRIDVNDFFWLKAYEASKINNDLFLNSDFEYTEIENTNFQVVTTEDYIELKGNLKDILGYTLQVYDEQVEISQDLNRNYQMVFKRHSDAFTNKTKTICDALGLSLDKIEKEGEIYLLDVKEEKFWNTEQIDWGTNNQQFLIGDSDFQADNVSVLDVAYKLAQLLEKPVLLKSEAVDNSLHDWQIHYKYFELMHANLLDDYGIEILSETGYYPQYKVLKKAP